MEPPPSSVDRWTLVPHAAALVPLSAATAFAVLDARGSAASSGWLWAGVLVLIVAGSIGLVALATAVLRASWRKAASIVSTLILATGLSYLALSHLDRWRLTREFDPIVYSGEKGLCSIPVEGHRTPFCPRVALDHPNFDPTARLIAADRSIADKDGPPPASDLVVADRRGMILKHLDTSAGFLRPVWAPDGRSIYAVSDTLPGVVGRWSWPEGVRSLVPIRGVQRESGASIRPQQVAFSPSGHRAVLVGGAFDRLHVADVADDGLTARPGPTLPFASVASPAWLSEAQLLVVAQTGKGEPAGLWEVGVETGALRQLVTRDLAIRDWLALSPDRTAAVVTATKMGSQQGWSLWRVELGTGTVERLTMGREDTQATWAR